jgi:peptidoglycan/xylan/chitin deacetylase (PgdA/CDA1 family)
VRGRVLEVKDSGYTRAFGEGRVEESDVLDVDPANTQATVVADLSRADAIPDETYDCFILTQTLGVIFDAAGALGHAARVLKPGGVLLCTVPAAGRISYEEGLDGDYWRFTEASVRRLFAAHFPPGAYEITGHGNVLAAAAFLYGLAPDELTKQELDTVDPFFPLVYTIRAVKAASRAGKGATQRAGAGVVLMYHRVTDSGWAPHGLSVTVEEFRGQLRHLRDAGYRVMPLHELVHAATIGGVEGRAVALTFDDGYVDSLTNVAPLLAEYGFPATFFLTGAALDGLEEFWWDVLVRMFFSGFRLPDRLCLRLADGVVEYPTSSAAERADTHRRLVERFCRLDQAGRDEALRTIAAWSRVGSRPPGAARPMTADEIECLAMLPGVSIVAHSNHHLWLPRLPLEQTRLEVETCKARLEGQLGRGVKSFSYPYGAHDADTERIVRAAGFEVAVTTEEQPLRADAGVNPFRVPRCGVWRGAPSIFASRLSALLASPGTTGVRGDARERGAAP